MARSTTALLAVGIAVAGLGVGFGASELGGSSEPDRVVVSATPSAVATTPTASPTPTSEARLAVLAQAAALEIPDIVERIQPSVVNVLVETPQGFSEGSGVVIDSAAGSIVTNDHVVAGARSVEVTLASGERIDADVLATDPLTDLAVITVERTDLPEARLADELPRVGELAIALGNALGFENSVTAGIVSGLHRAVPAGGLSLVDLVQTDAPISPGNSGGALVNAQGEVIGINVAAIPPTGNTRASSIGFAIPSQTVAEVVSELTTQGFAEHAFLGIEPANLAPGAIEQFDVDVSEGVLIAGLVQGGAAEAAGLLEGDVILSIDGEAIRLVEDLLTRLRAYDPGDPVRVEIDRDGTTLAITVALGGNDGR